MNIGIISDTHGCLETWRFVYEKYLQHTDLIIHAGDVLYHGPRNAIPSEYSPIELAAELNSTTIPIIVARGNCDAEVDDMVLNMPIQAPYAYVMAGQTRIVVNHGHQLTDDAKFAMAGRMRANVFITGHTHIATLEQQNGAIFINPGSPGMSKMPGSVATIARIIGDKVEVIDIKNDEVIMEQKIYI